MLYKLAMWQNKRRFNYQKTKRGTVCCLKEKINCPILKCLQELQLLAVHIALLLMTIKYKAYRLHPALYRKYEYHEDLRFPPKS